MLLPRQDVITRATNPAGEMARGMPNEVLSTRLLGSESLEPPDFGSDGRVVDHLIISHVRPANLVSSNAVDSCWEGKEDSRVYFP